MKTYLVKDLNDPTKLKVERRSAPSKNCLGVAPEGEEAAWLYKCPKDGSIKVDQATKNQVLHEREQARKKEEENSKQVKDKQKNNFYGTISQEDLAKAKSFDDLKRYISYLLDKQGDK